MLVMTSPRGRPAAGWPSLNSCSMSRQASAIERSPLRNVASQTFRPSTSSHYKG
jgi:hypothetical protein